MVASRVYTALLLETAMAALRPLLRSILRGGTDADIAQQRSPTAARQNSILTTNAAKPRLQRRCVDATNVVFDGTIPDLSYFQSLDHIVQTEPWLEKDKAMIDQLQIPWN